MMAGAARAVTLDQLAARYPDRQSWLAAHGLREMEPYPLLVFAERYHFETLWFGIRLYDLADYRFDRPCDTAVTIDDGLTRPADALARYHEPEPGMVVVPGAGTVAVVWR